VNDSDPDRRPRRPNQDFEWNADLMGSGLTVLGLLVVGAILLITGAPTIIALICVAAGILLLLWCLRRLRAKLSARHVGPQVPRGPGDIPSSS